MYCLIYCYPPAPINPFLYQDHEKYSFLIACQGSNLPLVISVTTVLNTYTECYMNYEPHW